MEAFLFRFGFESPEQLAYNERFGSDDEDSEACFIVAASEAEALEWGRSIAEQFVAELFAAGPHPRPFSWLAHGYAHWIESDPTVSKAAHESGCPSAAVGTYPDWSRGTA